MAQRPQAGEAGTTARLRQASGVLKAAGHPARLRILNMLRPGALCVCQITAVLQLAASTVSAHLAELNHSRRFWAVVRGLCPNYEAARDWLRRNGAGLHGLDFGGRAH